MSDGQVSGAARPISLPTAQTLELGILLSLVGGSLDAYTFVSRSGVFANAQTANVVLATIAVAQSRWLQALDHIPPIIAFLLGVVTATALNRPKAVALVRKPARAAIVLEILIMFLVGSIPRSAPDGLVTSLVSFAASVQVSTFRTLVDTTYATTMTTGNLRTFGENALRAFADHDAVALRRARQVGLVTIAFTVGALGGGELTEAVGTRAVWVGAGVLVLCLALFVWDERIAARRSQAGPRP